MLKIVKNIRALILLGAFTFASLGCASNGTVFHTKGEINIGGGVTGTVNK